MDTETDPNGLLPSESGAKLDYGKIKASLLLDFGLALKEVAKVCTYGANKYSMGGWQYVPNGIERYSDALWRHLLAEKYSRVDSESELLHAAHLAWNALARLELMLRPINNCCELEKGLFVDAKA